MQSKTPRTRSYTGHLYFFSSDAMNSLSENELTEYRVQTFETCLMKSPHGPWEVFKFDLQPSLLNDDEGTYRLFLYQDTKRMLGDFKYRQNPTLDKERLEGEYRMKGGKIRIFGKAFVAAGHSEDRDKHSYDFCIVLQKQPGRK